ncbi:putative mitochondrial 40s ribosomal protein mrp2 [Diaporthe ampelina]|uniref:Putative mitochondrial 40s ribosomal protein mrp2 n=1 Tax=Diaporthe ampelina TaxID=1214573 RepID=A0A0G2FRV1_9PEZI|nr:putative mitochondrial 40s ribosomal protein mrp2 [Diaporthe ampelina]
MFRRRWSGLPEDPAFPADLEKLGYCVEPKTDEIRLIDGPNYYFNYFQSKSMRHNDCQRFAFNTAVQEQLIYPRLEALGLAKLALPLGTATAQPHVPIFVSPGLKNKKRVVLIVGESEQELGVLAHRVIGGAGGVDKGSMVGIARAILQDQGEDQVDGAATTSAIDTDTSDNAPGLILANTGELWWWPEGGRGLTPRGFQGAPMRSAVHWGRFRDDGPHSANTVPRNGSPAAHVSCVFEQVVGNADLVAADAVVQVVGVGDGAAAAARTLDANWARWGGMVGCLAMCGSGLDAGSKARLYITCHEPAGTLISGPDGNDRTVLPTDYGTYIFSSGERYYTELTLIKARDVLLAWLAEVDRAGASYANPEVEVTYADELGGAEPTWAARGGGGACEDGPASGAAAAAGFQMPTREEEKESGLEIISREEWEDRLRREGKAVSGNVSDDGKPTEGPGGNRR